MSRSIALLAVLAAALLGVAPAAHAQTPDAVVVTSNADKNDATGGTGPCDAEKDKPGDQCTLRAAMETANITDGVQTIEFDLAITRILLAGPLPVIDEQVVIDGLSQEGARPDRPVVEIDGTTVKPLPATGSAAARAAGGATTRSGEVQLGGGADDLRPRGDVGPKAKAKTKTEAGPADAPAPWEELLLFAERAALSVQGQVAFGTVIRGLVIHGFPEQQLWIEDVNQVRVESSWIGLDPSGARSSRPGYAGVYVRNAIGTRIGGETAAAGNVISGNRHGIALYGPNAQRTIIAHDKIGTAPDGATPIGNEGFGVIGTYRPNTTPIGGPLTGMEQNVVSANGVGIRMLGSSDSVIVANTIGRTAQGRAASPLGLRMSNKAGGIDVQGADHVLIGAGRDDTGKVVDAGNRITDDRIAIAVTADATDIRVEGNRIGVNAAGTSALDDQGGDLGALSNTAQGIVVASSRGLDAPRDTTIGGSDPADGNVVGYGGYGITVLARTDSTQVRNNTVGLARAQQGPDYGILVDRSIAEDARPTQTQILDNVVPTAGVMGVAVIRGADTTVEDNVVGLDRQGVLGGMERGLWIQADDTMVSRNNVAAATVLGIGAVGPLENIELSENTVGAPLDGSAPAPAERAGYASPYGILLVPDAEGNGPRGVPVTANHVVTAGDNAAIMARDTKDLVVTGNLIGIGSDDEAGAVDGRGIVVVNADDTTIGGTTPADANVVGWTGRAAVMIDGGARIDVEGNNLGGRLRPQSDDTNPVHGGVRVVGGALFVRIGDPPDATSPPNRCEARCNGIVVAGDAAGITVEDEGTRAVAIRGNRVLGATQDIDLDDDGITPLRALADVPIGANDGVNAPTGVQATPDPRTGKLDVTGTVVDEHPRDVVVDVYLHDEAQPGSPAVDGVLVGTVRPDARGDFVLRGVDPDLGRFFSATATQLDPGATSESSLICAEGDGDGDAICDEWEEQGIDFDRDGVADYAIDGASTDQRDLLVEVDYAKGVFWDAIDGDGGWAWGALDDVQQAFAHAPDPVSLTYTGHIAQDNPIVDEEVPFADSVAVGATGPGAHDDLGDYRDGVADAPCDGFFGTAKEREGKTCWKVLGAKALVTRYVLMTNQVAGGDVAGQAAGGYAAVVGMGSWSDDRHVRYAGGEGDCYYVPLCKQQNVAATLMHELGHTLGLRHAPAEATGERGPDYLSVMNPSLTYRMFAPDRPLDLSRETLAPLGEGALDEQAGLGAPGTTRWPSSVRFAYDALSDQCLPRRIPTRGAVDWNGDGDATDTGVIASVNDPDLVPDPEGQEVCETAAAAQDALVGADDWDALAFDQRAVAVVSGAAVRSEALPGAEEALGDVDTDGDGVMNAADNCNQVANPQQEDGDEDGTGDACAALLQHVDLELTTQVPDAVVSTDDPFTVKVRLRNRLPRAATGVGVRVDLPEGWSVNAYRADETGTLTDARWTVGSVPARGERVLELDIRAADGGRPAFGAEVDASGQPDVDSDPERKLSGEDDHAAATVSVMPKSAALTVAPVRAAEGDGGTRDAEIVVASDQAFPEDVALKITTRDGTATAPEDYAGADRTVTLPAGQRSVTTYAAVRGDRFDEPDETFVVRAAPAAATAAIAAGEGEMTILDDDEPARPGDAAYLDCVSGPYGEQARCAKQVEALRGLTAAEQDGQGGLVAIGDRRVAALRRGVDGAATVTGCVATQLPAASGCVIAGRGVRGQTTAVAAAPDGLHVFVGVDGANADGVLVLRRTAAGELQTAGCYGDIGTACVPLDGEPVGYELAHLLRIAPDGRTLVALPRGNAYGADELTTFRVDPATGGLSAPRCYSERATDQSPTSKGCDPLPAVFSTNLPTTDAAVTADRLYIRSGNGIAIMALASDGTLTKGPCMRVGSECVKLECKVDGGSTQSCTPQVPLELRGTGGIAAAPDGTVAVSSDEHGTVALLGREGADVRTTGCVQEETARTDIGCGVRVRGLRGAGGLAFGRDGAVVHAAAAGGAIVTLERKGAGFGRARCAVALAGFPQCGEGGERGPTVQKPLPAPGGQALTSLVTWPRPGQDDAVALGRWQLVSETPAENRPPTCGDGRAQATPGQPLAVALRCADPDGDAVSVEVTARPAHGTLDVDRGGAGTYTPAAGFAGTDRLRFRATDGTLTSGEATLEIGVVDLAPACSSASISTRAGIAAEATVSCVDPEGGPLALRVDAGPARGSVEVLDAAAGRVRYRAPQGAGGADRFTVRARDQVGRDSDPAEVTVELQADTAPTCREGSLRTTRNVEVQFGVPCTDAEGDPWQTEVVGQPSNGALKPGQGATNALLYTPRPGFVGKDRLKVRAVDKGALSQTVTITIDVQRPPEPKPCTVRCAQDPDDPLLWNQYWVCDGRPMKQGGSCTGEVAVCTQGSHCPPKRAGIGGSGVSAGGASATASAAAGKKARTPKNELGRATAKIRYGQTKDLKVKLNAKARRLLRAKGTLEVKVWTRLTRPDGTRTTKTRVVTLKLAKAKAKSKPGGARKGGTR